MFSVVGPGFYFVFYKNLMLCWNIFVNSNIRGNEKSDELAKSGKEGNLLIDKKVPTDFIILNKRYFIHNPHTAI